MSKNIVISSDEKPYVHKEMAKHLASKEYEKEYLQIGDFIVANYVIERKQINDLYTSALDGRLFKQLSAMQVFAENNPDCVPILLIEGEKLKKELQRFKYVIDMNELKVNILVHFGVVPIFTKNISETVKFIKELSQYNNKDKSIIRSVRGFKRTKSLMDQKKFVLSSFPTIGEKKTKTIIQQHGTLFDYFKHVVENKTGTKVHDVLTK